MHYFMELNSLGQAHWHIRRWRGGGCVLGSTQPEHITYVLPYIYSDT